MHLVNSYKNDLLKSRRTPLLIELSKKDLNSICRDSICGVTISLAMAKAIYDLPLKDKNTKETNLIYIDTDKATDRRHIFLLEEFLDIIYDHLKSIKNLNIIKESISAGLSFATGGLLNSEIGGIINNGIEMIANTVSEDITDFLVDTVLDYIDIGEKISDILESKIFDFLNDKTINFLDGIKENNIYLSSSSKEIIADLSKYFKESMTPAESFRFILELMLSVAKDMPTLLYVKNPHKLDKNSLAILSLLYSISKDVKDTDRHTGLSVVYAYEDEKFQPYGRVNEEYKLKKQLLDEQRLYTQRYAMLERPTSDIPHIAVKSSVFVGREEELKNLNKRYYYSKKHAEIATIEIISGEPGIGKTKLVKKHLEQIRSKEHNNIKQIQLTLLNQVGHMSSNTGLSSLIDAIVREANRLESIKTFNEKLKDRGKNYIFGTIVDMVKNTLGVNTLIDVGGAVHDSIYLEAQIERTKLKTVGELDSKSRDNKQTQFNNLTKAIKQLKKLSDDSLPIVLFIDDLQWIDEDSSEYLLRYFVKLNVHIVATIRPSDAITILKKLVKNLEQNKYKIAFLKKVGITIYNKNSTKITIDSNINTQTIKTNSTHLLGLDFNTLVSLISQIIKPTTKNKTKQKILAKTIISELVSKNDKSQSEVNTLFAVETINMLCDKKLYITQDKDIKIEPLIIFKNTSLEFNTDIKNFQESVKNTFKILYYKYQTAFKHINAKEDQTEFKQKFNLMAYAVFEERLNLLKIYFTKHGNAVVNTLLFSSLLGSPFNSNIIKNILNRLSISDEKLLKPLSIFILDGKNEVSLMPEHYEIIEEVYEILSRYVSFENSYEYRHNLLYIFLDKQLEYQLDKILNHNNIKAKDKLYTLILDEIKKEIQKQPFYNQHENSLNLNDYSLIIFFINITLNVIRKAIKNNELKWASAFVNNSLHLSILHKNINNINISIGLLEELLNLLEKLYKVNAIKWIKDYTNALNNLSYLYYYEGNISEVIKLKEEVLQIRKEQYNNENINWGKEYVASLIGLASTHKDIGNIDKAVKLINDAIKISKKEYLKNQDKWADNYVRSLLKQARIYKENNQIDKSIELCIKSLTISEKHYSLNPHEYIEIYVRTLNNLSQSYLDQQDFKNAISYSYKSLDLLQILYKKNPNRWAKEFIINANSLSKIYKNNNQLNKCIEIEDNILEITSDLYNNINPSIWVKYYILGLINRANSYMIPNNSIPN